MVIRRASQTFRRAWFAPGPSPFGAVAGVALALALVAGGCRHGGAETGRAAPPPVPRTLADGGRAETPPVAVRRYGGRPVLGARVLSARSAAPRACRPDASLRRPSFAGAWVSTEGLSVGYHAVGAPPLWACDAARAGGRLRRCAQAASPSRDPGRVARAGGSVGVCGSQGVAFMWIATPSRAVWALVDHGSYWVGYPAPRGRLLRISGRTAGTQRLRLRVAFLAAGGRLLREESVQGFVAG